MIVELDERKRQRIIRLMLPILILIAAVIALPNVSAASQPPTDDVVQVETAWSQDRARPGDAVVLALVVNIRKGFHINADARQIEPVADFKPYPTGVQVVEAHEGTTIETPVILKPTR